MKNTLWLSLVLLSIALGASGQLCLKAGVRSSSFGLTKMREPGALVAVLLNPYVLIGVALFFASLVLWLGVIGGKQLSSVYPMVSIAYIIVAIASARIFGEDLSMQKVLGIALIVSGVFILNTQGTNEHLKPTSGTLRPL